jgi:hypothetical protein
MRDAAEGRFQEKILKRTENFCKSNNFDKAAIKAYLHSIAEKYKAIHGVGEPPKPKN